MLLYCPGFANSGFANSGFANSGFANSGFANSGVTNSEVVKAFYVQVGTGDCGQVCKCPRRGRGRPLTPGNPAWLVPCRLNC
ncbi:MAG: hypothetical protein CSB48_08960 [Proteobacteria bacterium]|nr:MAG: hypothetical protein CSB48_08960 [Pseudomonadota bacterium]